MYDDLKMIISLLGGLTVAALLLIYLIIAPMNYAFCEAYSTASERTVKFHYWSGVCYVQHDNQWFTREELKAIMTASYLNKQ
jgi:hypothetical protein